MNEHDFRALVDNHPRAIMLSTPEATIVYVNNQFQSVTGYRPEDIIGKTPSVLSSGLHSRGFYSDMWVCLEETGRWEGLIWNRRKNGENYPQWLTIYPVEYDGRKLYAGIFMDVEELTANDERLAINISARQISDGRLEDLLDLEVVAEGIETEAQKTRLTELKCHRGQRYLMARPSPLASLAAM
ncbi:MAG: PAS domain S-box protein [Marinobacter sp.]|nr:PAS domain S-box protein [Marinobacter sp.]